MFPNLDPWPVVSNPIHSPSIPGMIVVTNSTPQKDTKAIHRCFSGSLPFYFFGSCYNPTWLSCFWGEGGTTTSLQSSSHARRSTQLQVGSYPHHLTIDLFHNSNPLPGLVIQLSHHRWLLGFQLLLHVKFVGSMDFSRWSLGPICWPWCQRPSSNRRRVGGSLARSPRAFASSPWTCHGWWRVAWCSNWQHLRETKHAHIYVPMHLPI